MPAAITARLTASPRRSRTGRRSPVTLPAAAMRAAPQRIPPRANEYWRPRAKNSSATIASTNGVMSRKLVIELIGVIEVVDEADHDRGDERDA